MACCAKAILRFFKINVQTDKPSILEDVAGHSEAERFEFKPIETNASDSIELEEGIHGKKKRRWIEVKQEQKVFYQNNNHHPEGEL